VSSSSCSTHIASFKGFLGFLQSFFRDAIPAMLLIRLAISIFALTLLGLAISLSAAQSEHATAAKDATLAATLIHQ
jgi:hypothetical protein